MEQIYLKKCAMDLISLNFMGRFVEFISEGYHFVSACNLMLCRIFLNFVFFGKRINCAKIYLLMNREIVEITDGDCPVGKRMFEAARRPSLLAEHNNRW